MCSVEMIAEFYRHCAQRDMQRCPCCDHLSLEERGRYDICGICFWEDDGTNDVLFSTPFNPNQMTLLEGRRNYLAFGACDRAMLPNVEAANELQRDERAAWRSTMMEQSLSLNAVDPSAADPGTPSTRVEESS